MPSRRLTKDIREHICREILDHAYGQACLDQVKAEVDLTTEIFETELKDYLEMIESAPEGFFPTSDSIRVEFAGQVESLSFSIGLGSRYDQKIVDKLAKDRLFRDKPVVPKSSRRMPHLHERFIKSVGSYSAHHKFTKRREKLRKDREDLQEKIQGMKKKLIASLAQANTVKQLIDAWPEIENFAIKHETVAKKETLPVVTRLELNEALDLPPEEAAA